MFNGKTHRNKTTLLAGALLAAGIAMLTASNALALRYAGCINTSECTAYPPAGASCLVIFEDDGSQAVSQGFQAEMEWCAYVTTKGPTWGWPCGGAFITDTVCVQ
jgi:hypothetical protein